MKINTTLATIVAVTLMGSALCHAQDKSKQFEKIDADKNGEVTLEEWNVALKDPSKAEKNFPKLDTDKNGSVSLEEWTAGSPKKEPKKEKPAAE